MGDEEFKEFVVKALGDLAEGLQAVQAQRGAIYTRLEDHEERFDKIDRQFTNWEHRFAGIEARIGAIEGSVSYVAKSTEIALDKIRAVGRRVDLLENPQGPSGKGY